MEHGKDLCNLLDGMFSFVLLDESVTPSRIIAARDPIGITTLYQGRSSSRPGAVYFASELKALVDECDDIISFPPGHVYDSADGSTTRYFNPSWWNGDKEGAEAVIPTAKADLARSATAESQSGSALDDLHDEPPAVLQRLRRLTLAVEPAHDAAFSVLPYIVFPFATAVALRFAGRVEAPIYEDCGALEDDVGSDHSEVEASPEPLLSPELAAPLLLSPPLLSLLPESPLPPSLLPESPLLPEFELSPPELPPPVAPSQTAGPGTLKLEIWPSW